MAKPVEQLTSMEIKVLQWCSNGHTKARIAKQLGMSESYVKFFFERISNKLRARTAAHAVAQGFRRGSLK
jgi:DNA-binding CsgD family transcriptional regulator